MTYNVIFLGAIILVIGVGNRELLHVGRQHDGDGNQYNESMKIDK